MTKKIDNEDFRKRFVNELVEAEKSWHIADHLLYVTYPVVKDEKLLLRVLEDIYKAMVLTISTILKFEYLYKRVDLSKNTSKNLETFFKKCSLKYGLNEEENIIMRRIMYLGKKHKESGFEFSKRGKAVILDDELGINILTAEELKKGIQVSKKLLDGARTGFRVS